MLSRNRWILAAVILKLLAPGVPAIAVTTPDAFYKAYYLEKEQRDWNGAAELYEEIAADRSADSALRKKATARLAGVREEVTTQDLAALMPAGTLAYVEVRNPADRLLQIVDQLGLLADPDVALAPGGKRIAVHPALIRQLLGIRGLAVAVTGFDPFKQKPAGVLVFNPGDLEVIRALIETALPIGGDSTEPIGGFATYLVEHEVYVTLTSRLVVVSPQRALIENVVKRLKGNSSDSLAAVPSFMEARKEHDGSMLFFRINAKPIMPMVNSMMAGMGSNNRELAMAQALLDLNSLESLVGSVDVNTDGVSAELSLNLSEGHKNLVFDFLRAPAVNWDTLKAVPAGAAVFLTGAINEASSRYKASAEDPGDARQYVSMLDIGREVFANITSLAIFAMPPHGQKDAGASAIPDAGIILTVNDPAKSDALWGQMLGIASLAAGAKDLSGSPLLVEGVQVRRFSLPEGVTIHFATDGSDVIVTTTQQAMAEALQAKRSGKSVLNDSAFSTSLKKLDEHTSKGVFVHAGRALEMAQSFMPASEAAHAAPFVAALTDTVFGVVLSQSDRTIRITGSITGIPDIGDVVASLLTEQSRCHEQERTLRKAMDQKKWDTAMALIKEMQAEKPGDARFLAKEFEILAVGQKDPVAAQALGDEIFEANFHDAGALNNFAWSLLTDDDYGQSYADLALKMSQRSNDLTDTHNWAYVDTLAHANFAAGDPATAVELERLAIELSNGRAAETLAAALARFEAGAKPEAVADSKATK